jgi:hypothetical protein
VAIAVLVAVAGAGAAAVALSQGGAAARNGPATRGNVHSRLARELKQQLPKLTLVLAGAAKQAPRPQVPPVLRRFQQTHGYSCAVAAGTSTPCSLHPCTIYVAPTSSTAVSSAAIVPARSPAIGPAHSGAIVPRRSTVITPAQADRCDRAANAPARQIPIATG